MTSQSQIEYEIDEALEKARSLPPGALRSDALKKAGLLRATADRLAESKREAAKPASV
jgi:hypothetical protein